MIIQDEKARIEFKIIGYQFPNSPNSKKGDYNYDSNWLTIEFVCENENGRNVYRDSCLLTCELDDTIVSLEKIIDSEENAFISGYLEPYLKLSVAKTEDKYVIVFFFVYDVKDNKWLTFTVSETVSRERLISFKDELKEYLRAYPQK